MSEAHSPGPWTIDARGVLFAANGEELALVGWGTPGDAALIAAAPEMAALLRRHATHECFYREAERPAVCLNSDCLPCLTYTLLARLPPAPVKP